MIIFIWGEYAGRQYEESGSGGQHNTKIPIDESITNNLDPQLDRELNSHWGASKFLHGKPYRMPRTE